MQIEERSNLIPFPTQIPSAARKTIPVSFVYDPHKPLPTERVFYEGLIAENELAVWAGREKDRKTTLMLQFAICAAVGLPFLCFPAPPAPLRVVSLDFESKTGSIRRRYESMSTAMKLTQEQRQVLTQNLHILELRRYLASGHSLPKFSVKSKAPQDEAFWKALPKDYPADIYLIDPMRCLHSEDENDSAIEALLAKIRVNFGKAAVIIAHHMTKRGGGKGYHPPQRRYAGLVRRSPWERSHQSPRRRDHLPGEGQGERREVVYWGAFLKDAADIEPLPLVESDVETFYWQVSPDLPPELQAPLAALTKAGASFKNKSAAAHAISQGTNRGRSTAYRDVEDLLNRGFLVMDAGELRMGQHGTVKVAA